MNELKKFSRYLDGLILKQHPPRPGLVPQSGDPQHPKHWVLPDSGVGQSGNADDFNHDTDKMIAAAVRGGLKHIRNKYEKRSANEIIGALNGGEKLDRFQRDQLTRLYDNLRLSGNIAPDVSQNIQSRKLQAHGAKQQGFAQESAQEEQRRQERAPQIQRELQEIKERRSQKEIDDLERRKQQWDASDKREKEGRIERLRQEGHTDPEQAYSEEQRKRREDMKDPGRDYKGPMIGGRRWTGD